MAIRLKRAFGRLASIARPTQKPNEEYVRALRTYAKTEYGDDWRFALNYMLENKGKAPKTGVNS